MAKRWQKIGEGIGEEKARRIYHNRIAFFY